LRGEKIGGWNLPEGTVVGVTFIPKTKVRVAQLRLDMNKFRKVKDTHVGGVTYYINDKDSITYEVQQGRMDQSRMNHP
jgi:hypothetical protein